MKINKGWKIVIGIATGVVFVFPFVIIPLMFLPLMGAMGANTEIEAFQTIAFGIFAVGVPVIMLISLTQMGLIVFYISHNIKNRTGQETLRIVLAIGNLFLPFFSMPAYFVIYIWPDTPPDWALEKPKRTK